MSIRHMDTRCSNALGSVTVFAFLSILLWQVGLNRAKHEVLKMTVKTDDVKSATRGKDHSYLF